MASSWTSHGFDSEPVHFLWFLIRKERQEKRPVRERRKTPLHVKILAEKVPALPILKKVGGPTLEVLADYCPLGFSAGEC